MSTTTVQSTTEHEPESNVPHYQVGDQVYDEEGHTGRIVRVDGRGLGSQSIWLDACPVWCLGHCPAEAVYDIAEYDWAEHAGPGSSVVLPELRNMQGLAYAEREILSLNVAQCVPVNRVGWGEPLLAIRATRALTGGEVRSLAARLVRFADLMEDIDTTA